MKATIRAAASLVGALALIASLVPAGTAAAQSKDEVPRVLVMPFRSNVKGLGSEMAEDLRRRLASDISQRQMQVVSKAGVCGNLEASGFSCDSAPDQLTSKLLATSLRTEEYVEGSVTKTGKMMKLETLFYITGFPDATQVLPTDSSTSMGDLSSFVSKAFQAARKQVPLFVTCMHALQNNHFDTAITSATAAIAAYPGATASRVCLASTLLKQNAPSDSVLAVLNRVIALDPRNKLALGMLADEYRKRGLAFRADGKADSASMATQRAVEAWARLIEVDPRNVALVQDVVAKIALSGYAQNAVPIMKEAVEANPGDPDLVKLYWQILLAAASSAKDTSYLRQAVKVGDEMVRVDTSAADTTYFIREAAAYAQLGEVPKAASTLTTGIAKFPLNPSIWALNSQLQRLAGNPQGAADAATKLIQLDSLNGHAYLLLAQAQIDLGKTDDAVTSIRSALSHHGDPKVPKTGVDSVRAAAQMHEDSVLAGRLLLVMGNQTFKAAKAANPQRAADYKHAVAILAFADSVAPSPDAKFVRGVSAFFVGDLDVRENQTAKKCDLAQEAQQYFLIAQINIAAGGSRDPKTAQQLLMGLQQYGPAVDGQLKKFCK